MTCFLGDVVRWTPGDDYALVKPRKQFEHGFVRNLMPRELEVEFLASGVALWEKPGPRCQIGRWVLFQKGALTPLPRDQRRYQIVPTMPRIVIGDGLLRGEVQSPRATLNYLAAQLSARGTHCLAQDFKVYLKRGNAFLDYFGPFEQKGATFQPPVHPGTVKRYRVCAVDIPTVHLEEQELDILQPDLELVKVQESNDPHETTLEPEAPPPSPSKQPTLILSPPPPEPSMTRATLPAAPTLSMVLAKLNEAIPLQSLQSDLKTLELAMAQTSSLTEEELSLLRDAILDGSTLERQFETLLPILHEHGDFAKYFEKELEAHKQRLERQMEETFATILQGEQELEAGRQALAQERMALEVRREQLDLSAQQMAPETKAMVETPYFFSPAGEGHRLPGGGPKSATVLPIVGEPKSLSHIQGVLMEHIPLARLQVAWSVGRIPLLCGPRSLSLARTHADLVCGGRLRWASIDPLLVRVRDLIGTFVDGWFRPHPSGLASLLLQGPEAAHPAVVVFEGANRVPLELLLEPLLLSREAGLPLFAAEAFRQEDPWALLGQLPWPTTLLIACTLTVGAAKQPISPVLWDRLMVVDESGWPQRELTLEQSYLVASDFPKLIVPAKSQTGRLELQDFQDEVKEAIWAAPGALKVIQHLEALEVPDSSEEALILLLAAGALCAGADPEAMGTTFQEDALRRIERLRPYLA